MAQKLGYKSAADLQELPKSEVEFWMAVAVAAGWFPMESAPTEPTQTPEDMKAMAEAMWG